MHVVSQRPEFLGDGRDQLGVIAAREVRASDRAPEHDIAYEGDFRLLLEEDDVARCVAWAMPNAQRDLADLDLVSIRQPAVRGACFALKSVSATVLRQPLEKKLVLRVRALDRYAELSRQGGGPSGVIQMAVGQQNLFNFNLLRGNCCFEARDVAAGIDERCPAGPGAPNNRAVLSKRRDRKDGRLQRWLMHCVGPSLGYAINKSRFCRFRLGGS